MSELLNRLTLQVGEKDHLNFLLACVIAGFGAWLLLLSGKGILKHVGIDVSVGKDADERAQHHAEDVELTGPADGQSRRGAPGSLRLNLLLAACGVILIVLGSIPLKYYAFIRTLEVVASLTEDEYAQLRHVVEDFNREQIANKSQVRLHTVNVDNEKLLELLRKQRTDLAIFDINRRLEVVREDLVEPLDEKSGYDYARLIPSSVHPTLLKHLELDGRRYFLPYRPNVRIAWSATDKDGKYPALKTWQQLATYARNNPGAVLESANGILKEANSIDSSLLLLELIESARHAVFYRCMSKKPESALEQHRGFGWSHSSHRSDLEQYCEAEIERRYPLRDLCRVWADAQSPLYFLQELMDSVAPESKTADWQTATGHLISQKVKIARNWSFSLSILERAQELHNYCPSIGWTWSEDESIAETPQVECAEAESARAGFEANKEKWSERKFFTLMGGDVLALPKTARYSEDARDVMAYLMAESTQRKLVEGVAWPPMRFDARRRRDQEPAEETCQDVLQCLRAVLRALLREPTKVEATVQSGAAAHANDVDVLTKERRKLASDHVTRALASSAPTPPYWSPEMQKAYQTASQILIREPAANVRSALEREIPLFCYAPPGKHLSLHVADRMLVMPDTTDRASIRLELQTSELERSSHHSDLCIVVEYDFFSADPLSSRPPHTTALLRAGHTWVNALFPASALWNHLPRFYAVKEVRAHAPDPSYTPTADAEVRCKPSGQSVILLKHAETFILTVPWLAVGFGLLGVCLGRRLDTKKLWHALISCWKKLKHHGLPLFGFAVLLAYVLIVLWSLGLVDQLGKVIREHIPLAAWIAAAGFAIGYIVGALPRDVQWALFQIAGLYGAWLLVVAIAF